MKIVLKQIKQKFFILLAPVKEQTGPFHWSRDLTNKFCELDDAIEGETF